MLEQLWTAILVFIGSLVSPDWASLIALLPLAILGLVLLFLLWIAWRWTHAGPKRSGRPLAPRPPPGIHEAQPSWAPIFASVGAFVLFAGLVFHGWVIVLGITILLLALLFWLREAMRDYDHVEHSVNALVPVAAGGPPPGIHMPGPSFRPLLISISAAALFYGLVFGPWIIAAGAIMLVISMLQWLRDARREYRGVVIADTTGHLPADPIPGWPKATLSAFAVLFLGAILLQSGVLPPKSASTASGGTAGSPAPGSSASASGSAAASAAPSGPAADVDVVAKNVEYVGGTTAQHTAPANKAFTIAFDNQDAGVPHNISIREGGATGNEVWKGEIFPGVETRVYHVTPLKAATYTFVCDVHPTMVGTLVVQ